MSHDTLTQSILDLIANAKDDGIALRELQDALPDAAKHHITYRLGRLREQDLITLDGVTRGARYHSAEGTNEVSEVDATSEESVFSRSTLAKFAAFDTSPGRRPIARYERTWLEHFADTALWEEDELEKLHHVGQTSADSAPAGTYARQIHERLLIDLSWGSSALEGNTYTLLDTRNLIERGEVAEGKEAYEAQMILNHKRAIEFLLDSALEVGLRRAIVSNLHAELMDNLLSSPSALGAIREHPVWISGSTYTPCAIPQKLSEDLELILAIARGLEDPFEQAFMMLTALPYLEPFTDGNKRTARLLANLPLMQANLRPLSFVDVDRQDYLRSILCLYEQRDLSPMRELFVWAYERSCERYPDVEEILVSPDPFRLRHRDLIYNTVHEIVVSLNREPEEEVEAIAARHFESAVERARFVSFILADLDALHEGNYMRYRIRPSEFGAWRDSS